VRAKIDSRRNAGSCLGCGNKGHLYKDCAQKDADVVAYYQSRGSTPATGPRRDDRPRNDRGKGAAKRVSDSDLLLHSMPTADRSQPVDASAEAIASPQSTAARPAIEHADSRPGFTDHQVVSTSAGHTQQAPMLGLPYKHDVTAFAPNALKQLQDNSGLQFNVLPFTQAELPGATVYLSAQQLLQMDLTGKSVLLAVPEHEVYACLQHYLKCKQAAPETTKLVLILPPRAGPWSHYVKGFRVVAQWSSGYHVFQDRLTDLRRITKAVTIVTDNVPTVLNTVDMTDLSKAPPLSMLMTGTLHGSTARILFDTGALDNVVTQGYANTRGWRITPSRGMAQMADGHTVPLLGTVTVTMVIQSLTCRVHFNVIGGESPAHDAIIGNWWMKLHGARLHFDTDSLFVRATPGARKLHELCRQAPIPATTAQPHDFLPLSATQLKRALAKSDRAFYVILNAVPQVASDVPSPSGKLQTVTAGIPGQQQVLQSLLREYSVVFEDVPDGLPPDRGTGHSITLTEDARPTWRHPYRLSPLERAEAEKQIRELLAKGWIQPSTSPFGAPILFVTKKDGSLRMCVDYRSLNKVTVRNRFPLPRIDDLLDMLHGSTVFTSLDLASAYHQIRISPSDVPKTAFTTPFGHFEYNVLCFGLTNAPATFQSVMQRVFGKYMGQFVLVYMDDVLVFSKTAEEHVAHLRIVLQLLKDNQFYAKLSKCEFFTGQLKYLGHIIDAQGIRADPAKVAAVVHWPQPQSVHELRQFLGLTNYFRKFMQGYAAQARPLTELLKLPNRKVFAWTDACTASFAKLKHNLMTAPVLAMPNTALPYEVVCDASDAGVGAVLLQDGRPLAFESRKLTPAEQGYHATDRECLAVVHAMRTWRCYLEGGEHPVTLVTDHNPLVALQTGGTMMVTGKQMPSSRRQARWLEELQRYNISWEYRPGRLNVADPLSRHPAVWLQALTVSAIAGIKKSVKALPKSTTKAGRRRVAKKKQRQRIRLNEVPDGMDARGPEGIQDQTMFWGLMAMRIKRNLKPPRLRRIHLEGRLMSCLNVYSMHMRLRHGQQRW
jgi:hypothetical protein